MIRMKKILLTTGLILNLAACAADSRPKKGEQNGKQTDKSQEDQPQLDSSSDEKKFNILQGRETQNGDWTFAERGRAILLDAMGELKEEANLINLAAFIESNPDVSGMGIFAKTKYFIAAINEFISTIEVPNNQELLKKHITSELFLTEILADGSIKHHPQLDFFIHFGGKADGQDLIIYRHQIKTALLVAFLKSHNISLDMAPSIADSLIKNMMLFGPEEDLSGLRAINEKQLPWNEFKQVMHVINSHHYIQFGKSLRKILKGNGIETKQLFSLKEFTYNSESTYCNGSRCEDGSEEGDEFDAILNPTYQFTLKSGEKIEVNVEARTLIDIIETAPGHGFFEYRHYVSTHYTDDYKDYLVFVDSESSETLLKIELENDPFAGEQIGNALKDTYKKYSLYKNNIPFFSQGSDLRNSVSDVANKILLEAQDKLLEELSKDSNKEAAQTIWNYADQMPEGIETPEQLKQWFSDKIGSINKLSSKDLQTQSIGIKNFSYTADGQVFVQPAFYVNYGTVRSTLDQAIKTREVMFLMTHEAGHLLGLGDDESKNFADVLLRRMFDQGEGDIHSHFLRLSSEQKTMQEIAAIQNLKTTRLAEMQHKALREIMEELGYDVKDSLAPTYAIQNTDFSCRLADLPVSCMDTYTILRKTDDLIHSIELSNGKTIEIKMLLTSYVELESVQDNHGLISTWVGLETNSGHGDEIKLSDQETGDTLEIIPFEYQDDYYKRLFGIAYEVDSDRYYPF